MKPPKPWFPYILAAASLLLFCPTGLSSETGKKGVKPPTKEELIEPELPSWDNRTNPPGNESNRGNPIVIPFGLKWGESPEIVRKWSKEKGYNRRRYQDGDKLILEVEGPFENMAFQTIRFHYKADQLTEVELQYPPKSSESDGLFQLAQIKGEIEKARGKGLLEPQESGQEDSTFWRINRYTWNDGENFLWLVNFQMKEIPISKLVSITSLHYRRPEKN